MLDAIITSRATRELLGIFFSKPNSKFYVRELERLTRLNVNSVRVELGKLLNAGFLESQNVANLKYFFMNKRNPIYDELKSIFYKTQIIGDTLRKLFSDLRSINIAFIYGSVAKGEETVNSDIDLMLLGEGDSIKIHSAISKIEMNIGREINYTLINPKKENIKNNNLLKRLIGEEKIFLVGDEHGLKELNRSK